MRKIKVQIWFYKWVNSWANMDKHKEAVIDNKITDYGRGYKQAIRDVYDKIKDVAKN